MIKNTVKIFIFSFWLSIYFVALSPLHFFVHEILEQKTKDLSTKDECKYCFLQAQNQGLTSGISLFFGFDNPIFSLNDKNPESNPYLTQQTFYFSYFLLRGPPTFSM